MSNTNVSELAENQSKYLHPQSIQALNDLGIVLKDPENLIKKERERVNSWISAFENGQITLWESRDGIMKTNDTYESYRDKLLNEFYGDGNPSGTALLNNASEPDIYSQMECEEFYRGVDEMDNV